MLDLDGNTAMSDKDQITLLEIVRILIKQRNVIIATSVAISAAVSAICFSLPNQYTATATILPIERNPSGGFAALLGSMGSNLGSLATQAGFSGGGAATKFVTVLRARTTTESIINNLNLMPILFEKQWDAQKGQWKKPLFGPESNESTKGPSVQDAVLAMNRKLYIDKNKDDVISISFTYKDPEIAASITNSYVNYLDQYLKNHALSTAKRNRIFIENQIQNTQEEMTEHEISIKNFQQKNRIVSIDAQTEASVKAYSDLKSKLIASEVELTLLAKASIGNDPQVELKKQEISELKQQISKLENNSNKDPLLSFQNAPSLGLTYARLKRDLLIQEKVFELLTQQYEMAKIQEAQEDISFQILDPAIPPERKSGPRRSIIILIALFASTLIGSIIAFFAEFWITKKDKIKASLGF